MKKKIKKIDIDQKDKTENTTGLSEMDDYSLAPKLSCSGSGRIGRDFRMKEFREVFSGNKTE